MEGSGLEWENLALYSRRPIQLPFSMSCSSPITSSALLGTCPSSKFPAPSFDGYGNIGCSSDLMNLGSTPELSLGQQQEYSRNLLSSSIPVSSTPTKRSRASYHNMQNPCCQVEGCNLDLKLAKDYHRRHRICETHSKSPKVIVAGMERRFCQQCSRFHDLSEFDDKKRSCRRRLSDHNARRRRVQPESVQLSSAGLTPSIYDQRRQNVLLNGLPVSLPNSRWENAHSSMSRQAHIRPSKPRAMEGTLTFSNDDVHMDPVIHRFNPHILDQCLHVASTNSFMAPADLVSAHSLLSTSTWTMSERECAVAMEHGNYSPVMRHSESDSHYLKLFHNNNIGLNEGPSIPVHDAGPSHHQEYQLFKDPCDSATFYSAQRTL